MVDVASLRPFKKQSGYIESLSDNKNAPKLILLHLLIMYNQKK